MTSTKPKCYAGWCEKPARKDSKFCTRRCAADWAEGMVDDSADLVWCPNCDQYQLTMDGACDTCFSPDVHHHPKPLG